MADQLPGEPDQRYKQLALFTTIVAEVVVTPSVLGGVVFYLMRGHPGQTVWTAVAAFVGLGIGFYRIFQINNRLNSKSDSK